MAVFVYFPEGCHLNQTELRRLNELWAPVYPYLARQVAELVPAEPAAVLELGPFSGGLSLALAARWPRASFTLAAPREELAVLRTLALPGGPPEGHPQITFVPTALVPLDLPEKHYNLVIFRGAFFFLTPGILREAFRVLKTGGVGFIGGGYGRYTPPELIASLAEDSRDLNYRLGKRRVSLAEVEELIAAAGLATQARLTSEGALWIVLRRDGASP
jgi:SAM-dependent methyltransferase